MYFVCVLVAALSLGEVFSPVVRGSLSLLSSSVGLPSSFLSVA